MGRPLHALIGRPHGRQATWTSAVNMVAAFILYVAAVAYAQASSVELRSGVAQMSSKPSEIAAGGAIDLAASVPAGMNEDGGKLYLVQYTSEGTVGLLRDKMVAAGAQIIDYYGDQTLLVLARLDAIADPVTSYKALIAEYNPTLKVSPEARIVFKAAEESKRRRYRRSLLVEKEDTAGDSSKSDGSPQQTDKRADAPPSSLQTLHTWRMYTSVYGIIDADAKGTEARKELYAASVRLLPGLAEDTLKTIVSKWPGFLAAALGHGDKDACQPRFIDDALYSQSSPILHVYLCVEDYEAGFSWLSKMHPVVWLETLPRMSVRNAVAGWILQTGQLTNDQYVNPTANLRPYWKADLQGQGIIVGLGDTGIDLSHCNFIDDNYRPGSLRTMFSGSPPRLSLPNHRKVVQYVLPQKAGIGRWFGDEYEGHGSHTAGSLVAAATNINGSGFSNDASTGSAPMARISFFDYAPIGGFYVPSPIDDKILPYHYAAGARLTSESWGYIGATAVAYLESCRQFDAFSWRNPAFLSVIAAGNDGDNGNMVTVSAPATAKNVLAVGATVNQPKDVGTSDYNEAILFRYTDANGTRQQSALWPRLGSAYSGRWKSALINKEVPMRVSAPLSACTSLVKSRNYTGTVVLVDLLYDDCAPVTRAAFVKEAGAVAVVFVVPDDLFVDDNYRSFDFPIDYSFTSGLITRAQGLSIISVIGDVNNINPHMIMLTYPLINLGIDSLTYFSAYGPFKDGRIKPDIVAPGGLVTSTSSSQGVRGDTTSKTCSRETVQFQGTSMATPLTTGHLALVQQYFRDGYYPTGSPGEPASTGFEPSGMLLKAAAIVGAKSLQGGFASNVGFNLGSAPDGYQGWGRLDLSASLPLPGQSATNFRLQIADFGVISQGEMLFMPGIRATGTGPVFAALVWHDYPSNGAMKKNLVNDLDFGYLVNLPYQTNYTRTRRDDTNNVERIELTGLKSGDRITFVVHGRAIRHKLLTGADAQLPQRWAVAVVGHFNGTLKSPYNPAYTRPQRVEDTKYTLGLPGGLCASATDIALVASNTCMLNSSIFTFAEEADKSTGGYLYTIKDSTGKCLTVNGNSTGTPVMLTTCSSTAINQKMALFKSPFVDGPFYNLVPILGVSITDRRCLRHNGLQKNVTIVACNDDDGFQRFRLQRPPSVPFSPPLPPSPPPPLPAPGTPALPWYPYDLAFRTDWYPVGGDVSRDDYDYGVDDYGDYNNYPSYYDMGSDLDIIVSWTLNGVTYQVGRGNTKSNGISGAVYGGDNANTDTQFELVHWQTGITPPPAVFHVCVTWGWVATETTLMKVTMTVFKGYAVATATKIIDTSTSGQPWCNTSSLGYVGSYDLTAPPAPSPPPSPRPPILSYEYPLLFRLDWSIISGVKGRSGKAFDLELVVAWTGKNGTRNELGTFNRTVDGAVYGGDNMDYGTSYEVAYWPVGATVPSAEFHTCLRWYGQARPLAQVTLSVYRGNRLATTTLKTIDTTFDWSANCTTSAAGYIDSYNADGGGSTVPTGPACLNPPSPSKSISLYFLTEWSPSNGTTGSTAVYDWDVIVAWAWGGRSFELASYSRFVGGGVHTGDNLQMADKRNSEVIFWPTGVTGLAPLPAQYHVCVRWFQVGTLNVTLSVYLGENVVRTASRTWASTSVYSKVCTPAAIGYVGSYNYTIGSTTSANMAGGFGLSSEAWSEENSQYP